MDEFEDDLSRELAKSVAETAQNVVEDIVRPSSKSIGKNLGLMVDGAMGWLGCWGEKQKFKQEQYTQRFIQDITRKVDAVDEKNRIEPPMKIVGPAIESSRFFYEEEYYRDMFSNLLAAACDKSKLKKIHPSYIEIIKQLSPLDAKLLNMFKFHNTYPLVELQIIDRDKKVTPCNQYLFFFKEMDGEFNETELIELTAPFENLVRLGLVVKNRNIIELNFDYDQFKDHILYKACESTKEDAQDEITMIRYRMELTEYGRGFSSICIS